MLRYVKDGEVKSLDPMQVVEIIPYWHNLIKIAMKDGNDIYADKIIVV